MNPAFHDYFSERSCCYARYRPHYPITLFAHLASVTPSHELAWDCATGSGQAAAGLAAHYAVVIATDASAAQIAQAQAVNRVVFAVGRAEHSGLKSASVDLIAVAQALHWFDLDDFAVEVARVLKPGGVIAAWTYNLLQVTQAVDAVIADLYHDVLAAHWPPQRRLVETGYAEIELPFDALRCPAFEMVEEWTLERLVGFLNTWSAVRRYEDRIGENPLERVGDDLRAAWGEPGQGRPVTWPLAVRLWTK